MRTIFKQLVFISFFTPIFFVSVFFITNNAEAQTNSSPQVLARGLQLAYQIKYPSKAVTGVMAHQVVGYRHYSAHSDGNITYGSWQNFGSPMLTREISKDEVIDGWLASVDQVNTGFNFTSWSLFEDSLGRISGGDLTLLATARDLREKAGESFSRDRGSFDAGIFAPSTWTAVGGLADLANWSKLPRPSSFVAWPPITLSAPSTPGGTYFPGPLPLKKYSSAAQVVLWRDFWWPKYTNPAMFEGPFWEASPSLDDPTLFRIAVRHGFVPHTLEGLETWAAHGEGGRPVEGDEPKYSAYKLRTTFIQSINAIHNGFEQQYGPRTSPQIFTVLRNLWDTQNWFPLDSLAGPLIDSILGAPNHLRWGSSTTLPSPTHTSMSTTLSITSTPSTNTNQTTSTKFKIGDTVRTTANLNVRTTANGTLLGNQVSGNQGIVTGGSTYSGGYNWWNINYNSGADGWSAENYLALVSGNTSTTTSTTFTPTNPITSTTSSSFGTSTSSIDVKVGVTGVTPSDGPFNVNLGTPISISWRVTGTTPCFKSSTPPSEFTGALTPLNSGSINTFSPLGGITYKISCGNVSDTVVVNTAISNAPVNPNPNPVNPTPVNPNPVNPNPVIDPMNPNPVSTKFVIGDTVQSTTSLNVRSFANGTIVGTVSSGTQATVLSGPVSAGGLNWWRLSYVGGILGWSAENYLIKWGSTPGDASSGASIISSLNGILPGDSSEISWNYVDLGSSCVVTENTLGTLSNGPTQGTIVVRPTKNSTYWLDCVGATPTATTYVDIISLPPSQNIAVGKTVELIRPANVRSKAKLSEDPVGWQQQFSKGIVVNGPIQADGYIWWELDITHTNTAPIRGWVIGNYVKEVVLLTNRSYEVLCIDSGKITGSLPPPFPGDTIFYCTYWRKTYTFSDGTITTSDWGIWYFPHGLYWGQLTSTDPVTESQIWNRTNVGGLDFRGITSLKKWETLSSAEQANVKAEAYDPTLGQPIWFTY